MLAKKVKIALIIAVSFIIIAATLFILINRENRTVRILFYNTTTEVRDSIVDSISEEFPKTNITYDYFGETDLEAIDIVQKKSYDIIITDNYNLLTDLTLELKPINFEPGVIPKTPLKLGKIGDKRFGLPLQLDHIELALENSLFNDINRDGLIDLYELEAELLGRKSPTFYPLMVAGNDPASFIHFLSLLYLNLNPQEKSYNINNIDQNIPLNVAEMIKKWEKNGILHNQWREFTKEDVSNFLENGLTGASILPLSEHREYPVEIISNFTAVKFPGLNSTAASPMLVIPTMVYQGKNANLLSSRILKSLFSKETQRALTYTTGLSPVHSNMIPMDKQASDVRYWAAASKVLVPLY